MDYSVLLTVYKSDCPEYFKLSLESMINQTFPSNDIVIVLDGPVPQSIKDIIEHAMMTYPYINLLQLEKADPLISITPSGIATFCKFLHL